MPVIQLQIQEFMNYFSGSQHSYGEHIYGEVEPGKKRKGQSKTVTNKLITIEQYRDHLNGVKGLGIIPINENNKCRFGVIDVDLYDVDFSLYIEAIERNRFPLVPFFSKSGGLHLYLFSKEEISASSIIESLRKLAFLLSIDSLVREKKNSVVEVFPKQTKVAPGDVGSWINLPYFNADDTRSYAIRGGKSLSLNEALLYIKEKSVTMQVLTDTLAELEYQDAPPCLQLLNILNPLSEDSGRNNYLFSFGVYLKKKDEDFFEQNLQSINESLRSPLPDDELKDTVIASLRRKDYLYRCKENPCADFCNKKECRQREFGIGKHEGYFSSIEYGQLYQYKIAQPYYEWEVRLQGQQEFKRLRFKSEDEIIKQDTFLRLCMRELYELPSKLKQAEWFKQVNAALKDIKLVDVHEEEDTSPFIMLRNLIEEFLTGRAMAETKEQILAKRVYFNKVHNEYYFRVKDLNEFLYVQKQFRYFTPQELHGILRELKCEYKKITTESRKQIRVASFKHDALDNYVEPEIFRPSFDEYAKEEF